MGVEMDSLVKVAAAQEEAAGLADHLQRESRIFEPQLGQ
jgi:hypothetical protein